jgi:hypothetical protein
MSDNRGANPNDDTISNCHQTRVRRFDEHLIANPDVLSNIDASQAV